MITPIILCGGAGRRLWPVSRRDLPKQFLPLFGERSLFQETLLRVADPERFAPPVVVAAEPLRFIAADQARRVDRPVELLLEPEPRGAALALAAAMEHIRRRDPDALLLAMAADHLVTDPAAFAAACAAAAPAALAGRLVLFAAAAQGPDAGYGYVTPGAPLDVDRVRAVEAFVEKPDAARAQTAIDAGALWNMGYAVVSSETLRAELERAAPETAVAARAAVSAAAADLDFLRLGVEAYAAAPSLSLDRAVYETSDRLAVVETDCGWRDIASWASVWKAADQDAAGNAARGLARFVDAEGCLVHADPKMAIAVLGLENAMVVATPDAVLVADRAKADAVRDLVQDLHSAGAAQATENPKVFRPWGSFEGVDRGDRYQVKRIVVEPGRKLSLQKHFHRSEHWIVVKGAAEVTRDDEVRVVRENESIYLPQGCVHRLANPGKIPLELIEVQVGSYLGEDDIVRLEDDYNRDARPRGDKPGEA